MMLYADRNGEKVPLGRRRARLMPLQPAVSRQTPLPRECSK